MNRRFATFAKPTALLLAALLCGAAGCDSETTDGDDQGAKVTQDMQASIATDIDNLLNAAKELQTAAPSVAWNPTTHATEVAAMKAAWLKTRAAYENSEGVIAPLFSDTDGAIDARYDDYMTDLAGAGDANPFDGEGATGMHSIERILYSDMISDVVKTFEAGLPGNKPAAFPATDAEALDFKNKLCAQLVTDVEDLKAKWNDPGTKLDTPLAFQGLIDLMAEQAEKVNLASSGEEESRYSNRTMADLRVNLAGTKKTYELFSAWIKSAEGGTEIDTEIRAGFARIDAAYALVSGDAIPTPPAEWNPLSPSAADLETPFGKLWSVVAGEADPEKEGSVAHEMTHAAEALDIAVAAP